MKVLCECNSTQCRLWIEVPMEEFREIVQAPKRKGQWVISDECQTGPSPDDELITIRIGYKVYRGKP
jgi:hypothetical protein